MRNPTSRRHRRVLATGIRNLVDDAQEPPRGLSSAVPLARGEVLKEHRRLLDLATELAGDEEVNPRGVALVERLLTDGRSPIYRGSREGELHAALVHAHAALHLS